MQETIDSLKISIITATFNRARTVGDSILSVQSQRYTNIEHIIQDGASTDGTLEIIRRLADVRTKVESVRDGGIYYALNLAIRRCSGDVIGVMHSDDTFASDEVLNRVADAFSDNAIDGVYGDLCYVSNNPHGTIVRYWKAGVYNQGRLRAGWMPPHPTLYLRKRVFERWGAYNTSYRISADYEAMLRWLTKGNIQLSYIPEVLVMMRVGGESNKNMRKIMQKSFEDYRSIRRHNVGGVGTLFFKNISKIQQFVRKDVR